MSPQWELTGHLIGALGATEVAIGLKNFMEEEIGTVKPLAREKGPRKSEIKQSHVPWAAADAGLQRQTSLMKMKHCGTERPCGGGAGVVVRSG